MSEWVALLRAVNLGARNKVPMARLRELVESVGGEDVRTYIQSGNVLFEHRGPERDMLERAFAREFGFETVFVLRRVSDLRKLVGAHSGSAVAFLAEPPSARALKALAELDVGPDGWERAGRDLVLHLPNGFSGAKLSPALVERTLGVPATARNWRTVTRLAEG